MTADRCLPVVSDEVGNHTRTELHFKSFIGGSLYKMEELVYNFFGVLHKAVL